MFGSSQWMYSSGGGFYAHEIDGSLRFNAADSAYLSRTPGSAGNRQTFTFSAWLKIENFDNWPQAEGYIFSVANGSDNTNNFYFKQLDSGQFRVSAYSVNWRATTALYRDPSAWYHVVLACDSTQGTAQNRIRLYINGEEVTAWAINNAPSQNQNFAINQATEHRINQHPPGYNYPWGGYMAEVHFVDGQQLAPTSFGETKSGVWIPKAYSGSYGTNGFYLKFNGNANDSAGSNNWTANNLSSYDYVPDSPTNNFATWNPLASSNISSTQGNLRATTASAGSSVLSSIATPKSGKWYAEFICTAKSSVGVNIGVTPAQGAAMTESFTEFSNVGGTNGYGWYNDLGRIYYGNGIYDTYDTTYAVGDIIGVALDVDNGTVIWSKNGTAQSTYTRPSAGISYYFAASEGQGSATATVAANFGQDSTFQGYTTAGGNSDANGYGDFKYSVPSGYLALCTANLTVAEGVDPALDASPQDYFNTLAYSGDSTNPRTLTGVGFAPDLVWQKCRTNADNHNLFDVTRGAGERISTNTTEAETFTTHFISFNSDGFTVTNDSGYNFSGRTYVAWNWKANGTGTSVTFNTTGGSGSISGTRSVNTDAGMSIITYTAASSDPGNTQIAHGLGVRPDFFVTKCLDATSGWATYHYHLGTGRMRLNSGDGYDSGWNGWNSVHPDATNINLNWQTQSSGAYRDCNEQSRSYVMYAFAPVEGFSSFGTYIGNGSVDDGPFIYTGFEPAFIMVKCSSTSSRQWEIHDNKRLPYNERDKRLWANLSNAEATEGIFDFCANGVKQRSDDVTSNQSGQTYVYIAFAKNPFKYANAQ